MLFRKNFLFFNLFVVIAQNLEFNFSADVSKLHRYQKIMLNFHEDKKSAHTYQRLSNFDKRVFHGDFLLFSIICCFNLFSNSRD
jgi:hypothetical protein